jgi:septal ring factor EnvC (AmiA/AmiB activator)
MRVVAQNGDKKYEKIVEGIQYLMGDNALLREQVAAFAKRAEEDRRQAEERFQRALDRSDEKFERMMEKSDERFAVLLDQVKRTNRVAVDIARDIRRQTRRIEEGQGEIAKLLQDILKRLPPSNGKQK